MYSEFCFIIDTESINNYVRFMQPIFMYITEKFMPSIMITFPVSRNYQSLHEIKYENAVVQENRPPLLIKEIWIIGIWYDFGFWI